MWVSTGRTRYRKVWIEDEILKADDPYEPLWPFSHLDLPNEFARVQDSESAIRFELKYAPLDYDSLVVDPEDRKGGDPIEWVLKQAWYVRSTLELIYALAWGDGGRALRLFNRFVVHKDRSHPALRGTGDLTFPSGAYEETVIVPAPRSERDALWYAPHLISLLVNRNTAHIHQELIPNSRGTIRSVQICHSMIEAMWSMVGTLAMKAQHDEERPYFGICDECDTPFFAKDKRQKYCPPAEGEGKQSLCGLKHRQHKFKAKDNK